MNKQNKQNEKHFEFPSLIDFLEGNDTGDFTKVNSEKIAELTGYVLKLEYNELKILKTIATAAMDAMDFLFSVEKQLLDDMDEESEDWDEEEEPESEEKVETIGGPDKDAAKLRRILRSKGQLLKKGIYVVPAGAEFVFDEKDVLDPMIIVR